MSLRNGPIRATIKNNFLSLNYTKECQPVIPDLRKLRKYEKKHVHEKLE
jgi:hypothetical protein